MTAKRMFTVVMMLMLCSVMTFAQSIIGSWKVNDPKALDLPEGSAVTMTFKSDSVVYVTTDVSYTREIATDQTMVIDIAVSVGGTYTVKNGKVTIKKDSNVEPKIDKFNLRFPKMSSQKAEIMRKAMAPKVEQLKPVLAEKLRGLMLNLRGGNYRIDGDILYLDGVAFKKVAAKTTSKTATKTSKTSTQKKK